jgi:hypothetical protein
MSLGAGATGSAEADVDRAAGTIVAAFRDWPVG